MQLFIDIFIQKNNNLTLWIIQNDSTLAVKFNTFNQPGEP